MRSLILVLALANSARADDLFLRQWALTRGFNLGRPTRATPTPDGKAVLFLRARPRDPVQSLYQFDVATGQTRELLTPEQLLHGAEEKLSAAERARRERQRVTTRGFTAYELSRDGALLLVSLSGRLYTFRRADGAITELGVAQAPSIDPRLSPDGLKVAYVRERDLYVYDLAARSERRLTRSERPTVTNGLAEFVAQEEMDRSAGFWWSGDSRSLAYEEADAAGVETLHVADAAHPESAPEPTFYPRAGKANVKVRLGVIPAAGGATTWIAWDALRLPYLAKVVWEDQAPLTLVVMDRAQRDLEVLAAEGARTRRLLAEHDDAWLNLDPSLPRWLPDGSQFLWSSERAGAWQLELRARDGQLVRGLGSDYRKLVDLDDPARVACFLGGAEPTEQHLFAAPLDGGAAQKLTREAGVHVATFGRDHHVWVDRFTTERALPRSLVRAREREVGELPSVAESPPLQPTTELVRAGELAAAITRPHDFDRKRRYPVVMSVYGGPHAQVATRKPALFEQWLADHGVIVVSLDGHGTPNRGRAWERAIAGDFSRTLDDQVTGLRALAERYHELDLSRVGVYGWSFGGYLSALAVLKRPDVFHVAVAGAPVVDWRDYDTFYTERYLGLPDANEAGYARSSLLGYAAQLSRPLLLVHGTSDDNVYFFHTLKLADALFRAGKKFELLPLAGLTHLVPDPIVTERLWTRIVDHLLATLRR
jgi:dipeptidyl-peptidase-4